MSAHYLLQLRRRLAEVEANLEHFRNERDDGYVGWEEEREALLDTISEYSERSRGGILRFSAAVERLPMRDSAARRWLRSNALVGDLDGREIVCWPDVLDALRVREAPKPKRRRQSKPTTTLPRVSLD